MKQVIKGINISKSKDTLDLSSVYESIDCVLKKNKILITKDNCRNFGIFLGATLSNFGIRNINAKNFYDSGVRAINPADFPKGLISYLAGNISIKFNIRGANVTLSSGISSGTDALLEGIYFLHRNEENKALVVELGESRNKNAIYPIEKSACFLLENLQDDHIGKFYTEVIKTGFYIENELSSDGLLSAIQIVLKKSSLNINEVGYIFCNNLPVRLRKSLAKRMKVDLGWQGERALLNTKNKDRGLFFIGSVLTGKNYFPQGAESSKISVLPEGKKPVAMFLCSGKNSNSSCFLMKINQ